MAPRTLGDAPVTLRVGQRAMVPNSLRLPDAGPLDDLRGLARILGVQAGGLFTAVTRRTRASERRLRADTMGRRRAEYWNGAAAMLALLGVVGCLAGCSASQKKLSSGGSVTDVLVYDIL